MRTKAMSILLALVMLLGILPMTALAEATASDEPLTEDKYDLDGDTLIYVGGVRVTEENRSDVFGDGKVSYDPETATLTLNGWSYEGDGYEYGGSSDGTKTYSAVIYADGDLTVRSEGENLLRNTFTDEETQRYGDGIVAKNSFTLVGDGKLTVFGAFGISSDGDVTVDDTALELTAQDGIIAYNVIIRNGATVTIDAEDEGIVADDGGDAILKDGAVVTIDSDDAGIVAFDGDAIVENGVMLTIRAVRDGIYARHDATVTDSVVQIETEEYGIYAYDGCVTVGSTNIAPSADGPMLDGTRVSVTTGMTAIFAYTELTVDEKLVISEPESGGIGESFVDIGEDGGFTYETVMIGGEIAKNVVIEPLGYTVTVSGLSYGVEVPVPAGQSLNGAYCELYGVEDFAETLDTAKEGFTFAGWYTDEQCSEGHAFDFNTPVNADITVYAKWVADGADDEPGKDDDLPQPGDNSHMALWIALLFISGGAAITLTVYDRKRRKNTV